MKVSVYEQEMFGAVHWRVMRDDWQRIFGAMQVDFPSREEAHAAIHGECRRNRQDATVTVHYIDHQTQGRNRRTETFDISPCPECGLHIVNKERLVQGSSEWWSSHQCSVKQPEQHLAQFV